MIISSSFCCPLVYNPKKTVWKPSAKKKLNLDQFWITLQGCQVRHNQKGPILGIRSLEKVSKGQISNGTSTQLNFTKISFPRRYFRQHVNKAKLVLENNFKKGKMVTLAHKANYFLLITLYISEDVKPVFLVLSNFYCSPPFWRRFFKQASLLPKAKCCDRVKQKKLFSYTVSFRDLDLR